jgi:hypothetical protein
MPRPYGDEVLPNAEDNDDEAWYDAFDVRMFGDAYAGVNYNFPKPQAGSNGVSRYFDPNNGFALSWVGLDLSRVADPIGGTLSLRFGPSAHIYGSDCPSGHCDAVNSLENVKQAFASWKPVGALTLDFGKFDSIFGSEVADSQDNLNYTRGVLYALGQPHFHTGLRASLDIGEYLTLRALAVNGWNISVDNNAGKTFGLQATARVPGSEGRDLLAASLGYLIGPESDDVLNVQCLTGEQFDPTQANGCAPRTVLNAPDTGTIGRSSSNTRGLRQLIDLVVTSDPLESLHLVANGDFGTERVRNLDNPLDFDAKQWWGGMIAARYGFSDAFGIAARGEYFHDDDGLMTKVPPGNTVDIVTGTLTLDYRPGKNLILRLDNRLDWSNHTIFQKGIRGLSGTLPSSTLGVVVTTN